MQQQQQQQQHRRLRWTTLARSLLEQCQCQQRRQQPLPLQCLIRSVLRLQLGVVQLTMIGVRSPAQAVAEPQLRQLLSHLLLPQQTPAD